MKRGQENKRPELSEALTEAKRIYQKTGDSGQVRQYLKGTGLIKKSQVYFYATQIKDEIHGGRGREKKKEEGFEGELEFREGYTYNSGTKDYVFLTQKILGKSIVLKESTVKAIIERYSSFDGDQSSINEIVSRFGLRREAVIFILRALRKTHDSLPVLDEELLREEPEDIVSDLLTQRLWTVNREYEKKSWKRTVEESKQWRGFLRRDLNPYERVVESFSYQHKGFKLKTGRGVKRDRCYMIGVSDVHFGSYALRDELFRGKEWNIKLAQDRFKRYVEQVYERIAAEGKNRPKLLYVLAFGDIAHSLNGGTTKGTKLENIYPEGEPQIEAGFYCLDYQIQAGLEAGYEIEFIGVEGNHNALGDWAIYKFIEKAYQKDERVRVSIVKQRWAMFRFLKSLFVMEHGASAYFKSRVPKAGSERDSYVQKLLLANPKELAESEYRYFLTADQHRLEVADSNGFEFIRFGTMVRGDKYADHHNLGGRPRQNVLEVDEEGVRAIYNFWAD